MSLNKYQSSVLAFLFDRLPIGEDVDSLEFSLKGDFHGKFSAAHAPIEIGDRSVRVVFNLPRYSRSVFLALAKKTSQETARILANLEDFERESSTSLGLGEVVVLPGELQKESQNIYAVILLRTATSLDCKEVPDQQEIAESQTSFFLVVPITEEEWNLRQSHGHDALMDKFQSDDKQLSFE